MIVLIAKTSLDAIEDGSDLYRLKTEDGFEIRKLYIKLLEPCMGSNEIRFLLTVFGPIEEIIIFGKTFNSGWKMKNRGFVTFSKGVDASCALVNRKKFIDFFILSPADTWNQPDFIETKHETSRESFFEDTESKLLEKLNDDCLLHLMSFLDILDVISLKKVCTKFLELAEVHLKSVKRLNFNDIKRNQKLTLHEAKLVLEAVGLNIVKASINSEKFRNQRILSFIPKYLTNVKHLLLKGFKLESLAFWNEMAKVLRALETLDLSDNSEINENFLKSFKNSPQTHHLKALNISNCNVNGKFLKMIPKLESLNISGCRYITGKQVIEFGQTNEKLKSLDISKCPNIFGKDANDILKSVPQLEVLSLNNYYIDDETSKFVIPSINPLVNLRELTIQNINYPPCDQLLRTINLENRIEVLNISYGNLTLTSVYAISTMKSLRKLIMNFKNSVPEDLVDYLMDLTKLEEVHLSGCSYISPANALRVIQLPKMIFLDISRCYGFTNEFIVEAVALLKEVTKPRRFQMLVGQTEVDQNVLKLSALAGSCKIIRLHWEVTKDVEHDYDIDEENKYEVNKAENLNQQEIFTIDGRKILIIDLSVELKRFSFPFADIINILSNLDECDPNLVATIKRNL